MTENFDGREKSSIFAGLDPPLKRRDGKTARLSAVSGWHTHSLEHLEEGAAELRKVSGVARCDELSVDHYGGVLVNGPRVFKVCPDGDIAGSLFPASGRHPLR